VRERLQALSARRAQLVAQARAEREALAGYLARTEAATVWLDSALRLLAEAKRHPVWVVGGIAAAVALRPKRALRWLANGWSLWQASRGLRLWWRRLEPVLAAAATAPAPRA